jgi:SAM-dependent methyltransferase
MRILASVLCLTIGAALLASGQAIDPRDRDYWNGKYSDPKSDFNRQPSHLLVEAIRGRKTGSAIDLGMGEGRNAIYLAQQGWHVTGVDIADVAVGQARKRATQLGVSLDAMVDDLDRYDLGRNQWDLVTLFYMHAWYHGAKPQSVKRLHEALRPGGLLVIEGFAGSEEFMFQPNELLRDFADFKILRYEDVKEEADWAPGQKSHIIRFVGEKVP